VSEVHVFLLRVTEAACLDCKVRRKHPGARHAASARRRGISDNSGGGGTQPAESRECTRGVRNGAVGTCLGKKTGERVTVKGERSDPTKKAHGSAPYYFRTCFLVSGDLLTTSSTTTHPILVAHAAPGNDFFLHRRVLRPRSDQSIDIVGCVGKIGGDGCELLSIKGGSGWECRHASMALLTNVDSLLTRRFDPKTAQRQRLAPNFFWRRASRCLFVIAQACREPERQEPKMRHNAVPKPAIAKMFAPLPPARPFNNPARRPAAPKCQHAALNSGRGEPAATISSSGKHDK